MIDPSSMVAVIDELEELGLAERQTHPSDRRKHAVHLTDQGRKTLQRARASAIETAKELFAPLDAAETRDAAAAAAKAGRSCGGACRIRPEP